MSWFATSPTTTTLLKLATYTRAGSKLSVTPACDMPFYCKEPPTNRSQRMARREKKQKQEEGGEGAKEERQPPLGSVAICNLQRTDKDDQANLVIHHTCDTVMVGLLDSLKRRIQERSTQAS
jgi:hypothetical protein